MGEFVIVCKDEFFLLTRGIHINNNKNCVYHQAGKKGYITKS